MSSNNFTFYVESPEGFVAGFNLDAKIVNFTHNPSLRAVFNSEESAENYVSLLETRGMRVEDARILPIKKESRGGPAKGFH